jgi:hypothetical protein
MKGIKAELVAITTEDVVAGHIGRSYCYAYEMHNYSSMFSIKLVWQPVQRPTIKRNSEPHVEK